jgi:hypothetical protein
MGFKRLVFYNHFGAGDIFESREFVKDWMKLVPAEKYFYAHGKHPKILKDLPELEFTPVTEEMNGMKDVTFSGEDLFVNTWIGRDGRYVLPGIGCVVEKLYEMHNDMLYRYGFGQLPRQILEYVPTLDYSYYKTDTINDFIAKYSGGMILISNGNVQSSQANNFDMTPSILSICDKFTNNTFIITQPIVETKPNLFLSTDIIKSEEPFDLNEVSYLSLFCGTIIGRNSGPHVFAQVLPNWMSSNSKKILSFTYTNIAATFVLNQTVRMRKFWSPATTPEEVTSTMERVIEYHE